MLEVTNDTDWIAVTWGAPRYSTGDFYKDTLGTYTVEVEDVDGDGN